MKIYTAGPMTGYPEFNYPAFRLAEADLKAVGYDVLCPVDSEEHNDTGKPQTWGWYMRHALRMVLDVDAVALLPGWEDSKGAQLEVHVARQLRLPIEAVSTWLSIADAEAHAGPGAETNDDAGA